MALNESRKCSDLYLHYLNIRQKLSFSIVLFTGEFHCFSNRCRYTEQLLTHDMCYTFFFYVSYSHVHTFIAHSLCIMIIRLCGTFSPIKTIQLAHFRLHLENTSAECNNCEFKSPSNRKQVSGICAKSTTTKKNKKNENVSSI